MEIGKIHDKIARVRGPQPNRLTAIVQYLVCLLPVIMGEFLQQRGVEWRLSLVVAIVLATLVFLMPRDLKVNLEESDWIPDGEGDYMYTIRMPWLARAKVANAFKRPPEGTSEITVARDYPSKGRAVVLESSHALRCTVRIRY